MTRLVSILCSGWAAAAAAAAPPPAPAASETFSVLAIWEGIRSRDEAGIAAEMDRLIAAFGRGDRTHRVGFAFILPPAERLRTICRVARDKGLVVGVILANQSHTRPDLHKLAAGDLRCLQWRLDGRHWRGHFTKANNAGAQEIPEDGRDDRVVSPSRYNRRIRDRIEEQTRSAARTLKAVATEFPGVVTVVNTVIEEELAIAAASLRENGDAYLGDYSPFAVAEFRDWLRHTGGYDADGGRYAGQGAPAEIVGPLITIAGKARSPFHDDPSPGDSGGTGRSFNETFGTSFATWTLRSWDPAAFPDPIADPAFDPSPASGRGHAAGGFDAPRVRDGSAWWRAWSWDWHDRGRAFPPGGPAAPAYGFRQRLVAHYVRDMADILIAEGLPAELVFAHQIPGEAVGERRGRSSASPTWTGYLPAAGTVGITRFGPLDPALVRRYADLHPAGGRNWGIFEWHPAPGAKPADARLYDDARRELRKLYDNRCRVVFAGWWLNEDPTFPLDGSRFADAIRDFLAERTAGR